MTEYHAQRARIRWVLVCTTLIGLSVLWSIRHFYATMDALQGHTHRFGMIYSLAAAMIVMQLLMCFMERPYSTSDRTQRFLDRLTVTAIVPVYNEDDDLLVMCLRGLANQTRRPDRIIVVDDGSKKEPVRVRRWAEAEAMRTGTKLTWVRSQNQGKRHAQGLAVKMSPETDIYLTVDSDSILDRHAIQEGLKPFAKRDVKAVAGVVLAANNTKSLLARFTDLWYVTSQLVDRSSLSAMGSVLVNSGPLAFYRAEVVRENLTGYLNETIGGRPVMFSDDSMLTLYARMNGKTVQQPTAFVFSAMPYKVGNHFRQYIRWMRGSTIRSLWRFRYLPMTSYVYWAHFLRWVQMAISSYLFVSLFIVSPIADHAFAAGLLFISMLIGYAQGLRYLTVRRADESLWSQLNTWAMAPLAALWAFFILRPIRWYAMCTCMKTGWGTRKTVEVTLE